MKKSLWVLAVLGLCVVAAFGAVVNAQAQRQQPPPPPPAGAMADHAAVEKALMANEVKVNEMWVKRDVAGLKAMIADDGFGVDMMGPSPVSKMFAELPTMDFKITEQKQSDFHYTWADANTVVVSYTWTGKGTAMGQPVPSPTYATTVWTKRGGKWLAVFHQETVAMPMPPKK